MKNAIIILGASSSIARAIGEKMASDGKDLILAGRDREELERIASDLRVRYGIDALAESFDAVDLAGHVAFFDRCKTASNGDLSGVVLCHGFMAPQNLAQSDGAVANRMIQTNYTSAVSVLELAAGYFEQRKSGFICAVSSVAGDRGRQSNYIYGSAKAGLSTYLQGLRNRLTPAGIPVITVKPGFVDTSMTWGLPGLFLVASPTKVALDICRAIRKGKAEIYTPWFWRYIMMIIKSVPEPIFRKMKM